jgi:TetR/AcrR family transcriptional regulator, regulator of cefoperazone and chloramphenicol sensitivity
MHMRPSVRDRATRQRLLETAAHLFSERGFRKVTVRDISREAATNVAAINYHFGGKLGLYEEVVEFAAAQMESAKLRAMQPGKVSSPEEQLRSYIRLLLRHLMMEEEDSWMDKLIGREMADPTPGLDVIIERGIKPTADRLAALISRILSCPPSDERVWQCAVSVQAQCLFYRCSKPVFARMAPSLKMSPELIDRIADHIAEFSLAGIRSIAREMKARAKQALATA